VTRSPLFPVGRAYLSRRSKAGASPSLRATLQNFSSSGNGRQATRCASTARFLLKPVEERHKRFPGREIFFPSPRSRPALYRLQRLAEPPGTGRAGTQVLPRDGNPAPRGAAAGELLAQMPKASGGEHGGKTKIDGSRSQPSNPTPTLEHLGITKTQSAKWQKLAALPEEKFEVRLEHAKARVEAMTTSAPDCPEFLPALQFGR
jgi:hypothetical protein